MATRELDTTWQFPGSVLCSRLTKCGTYKHERRMCPRLTGTHPGHERRFSGDDYSSSATDNDDGRGQRENAGERRI